MCSERKLKNANGKGTGKEGVLSFTVEANFDGHFFPFMAKTVKSGWKREPNGENRLERS